jgi:hypothetical protein
MFLCVYKILNKLYSVFDRRNPEQQANLDNANWIHDP